jgi:hypothetical protein
MSPDGSYNGYANYQTWNVCLWISNDEMLYGIAKQCECFSHFRTVLREMFEKTRIRYETSDGVAWNDSGINMAEMEEYWNESFSKVCA